MSITVKSIKDFPSAEYYVVAIDSFMSGWGEAEGKRNKIVLPCDSYEEAEVVLANTESRSDMKRAHITSTKPPMDRRVLYSLFSKKSAASWYKPGGFA